MSLAIDHVMLNTRDLDAMTRFFEQALELKPGFRPAFGFAGAWLWSDGKPLIHLRQQAVIPADEPVLVDHIAFRGTDYQSLKARLARYQLPYAETTVPGTGERQVFIAGPEGVRIEVQFLPTHESNHDTSDS